MGCPQKGRTHRVNDKDKGPRILPTICFEVAEPASSRRCHQLHFSREYPYISSKDTVSLVCSLFHTTEPILMVLILQTPKRTHPHVLLWLLVLAHSPSEFSCRATQQRIFCDVCRPFPTRPRLQNVETGGRNRYHPRRKKCILTVFMWFNMVL